MSAAFIEAISFAAPGLPDWPHTQTVLRNEQAYVASELPVYQPALLPANERRRASPTVRMAFRVAEAATQASSIAASELATVFASADGDLNIAQRICAALAEPQRFISPTDFHNSVHNAAAGYWSIASQARGPSTAIAGHDHSFAVGLLEALSMVIVEQQPTLLVAYDVPAPMPLLSKRPVRDAVGVGLILTPQRTRQTLATLTVTTTQDQVTITPMQQAELEALRLGNPAARALPLLQLLAYGRPGSVTLALPNDGVIAINMEVAS
ncbi:MAG: beta-ketoacyl synthase chain length factor [Steroidobacteraceae bacterium]